MPDLGTILRLMLDWAVKGGPWLVSLSLLEALIGTIYLFLHEPIVVTSKEPYLVPHYPIDIIGSTIPKQRDGAVVVLLQRTLFDIDHWHVARDLTDPTQCEPPTGELSPCDESHAYGSWTVIVPADGAKLYGISSSTGKIDRIVALTPHTIRADPPTSGLARWEVENYHRTAGQVEVIALRRDFYGAFQPVPKEKIPASEPDISPCTEASAAIVIANPTARAELIVHTPPELPINQNNFRLWSYKQGDNRPTPLAPSARDVGDVETASHNLYWRLGTTLLKDAYTQRVVYKISWQWERPISEGPVCAKATLSK